MEIFSHLVATFGASSQFAWRIVLYSVSFYYDPIHILASDLKPSDIRLIRLRFHV